MLEGESYVPVWLASELSTTTVARGQQQHGVVLMHTMYK
jgi:hypothetical protein